MQVFYKRLLTGDRDAVDTIKRAGAFFKNFYVGKLSWKARDFATEFSEKQLAFEHAVSDDRFDAKWLMPFAALGELYSDMEGFGDNAALAKEVYEGFGLSTVSLEVKSAARQAAEDFSLDID